MRSQSNADRLREEDVTQRFLNVRSEESFADLFRMFTPQLLAFFRARRCEHAAEDLAQDVMLTVYRNVAQLRDRASFRAWMFRIARNLLCRHYGKQAHEVETVGMANLPDREIADSLKPAGTPAFEFHNWVSFLGSRERETLELRFIEEWEYHEIAAAQHIPIGTVQWRVFSAKKKLAPLLTSLEPQVSRHVTPRAA
jgi:RNA polymerase sigma-70 factor, ECF subfamily